MKKVVRLTEEDLVRIVKRVVNEQLTNPKPSFIKIPEDIPYDFRNNLGLKPNSTISHNDFLSKLEKPKIGINAFHIKSDGWQFPIFPVYANFGNFRISFEPFNKEKGIYMLKWTKVIPFKK